MTPCFKVVGSPLVDVAVRRMVPGDEGKVVAILRESREAALWSEASLHDATSLGAAWIAEVDESTVGFLVGRTAADELEILNLAVAAAYRRRGIASRLVSEALRWSCSSGAKRAYLELRASNDAAMALYLRHGFAECGRRKSYYRDPVEDAISLALEITGTA